jgi:hypothetical protein
MMDYSVHMLARSEHELMIQSLPTVHDFDYPLPPEPSRWARLLARIRTIGAHLRPSPRYPQPMTRPSLTVSNPTPFLRDRIQEDSNYEMEWLWAASQVTVPEEIRYCLERVLYINPNNRDTQYALSILVARRVADETLQEDPLSFAQISKNQ